MLSLVFHMLLVSPARRENKFHTQVQSLKAIGGRHIMTTPVWNVRNAEERQRIARHDCLCI